MGSSLPLPLPSSLLKLSSARAEKRKWLCQCPAASNVGSGARSFKMIGILREKNHLCLK